LKAKWKLETGQECGNVEILGECTWNTGGEKGSAQMGHSRVSGSRPYFFRGVDDPSPLAFFRAFALIKSTSGTGPGRLMAFSSGKNAVMRLCLCGHLAGMTAFLADNMTSCAKKGFSSKVLNSVTHFEGFGLNAPQQLGDTNFL
jgi:hypothetical protein